MYVGLGEKSMEKFMCIRGQLDINIRWEVAKVISAVLCNN